MQSPGHLDKSKCPPPLRAYMSLCGTRAKLKSSTFPGQYKKKRPKCHTRYPWRDSRRATSFRLKISLTRVVVKEQIHTGSSQKNSVCMLHHYLKAAWHINGRDSPSLLDHPLRAFWKLTLCGEPAFSHLDPEANSLTVYIPLRQNFILQKARGYFFLMW